MITNAPFLEAILVSMIGLSIIALFVRIRVSLAFMSDHTNDASADVEANSSQLL
jgi:hypothetical protein